MAQCRHLDGEAAPFRTAADRKKLIGKCIQYLRYCDIDRSGRGLIFPRVDWVTDAKGVQLIFSNGSSVSRGELVEIRVLEADE